MCNRSGRGAQYSNLARGAYNRSNDAVFMYQVHSLTKIKYSAIKFCTNCRPVLLARNVTSELF